MLTWQGVGPQLLGGGRGGRGGDAGAQGDQPSPRTRAEPVTLRMTLGEYKTVNGIRLPHLITRGANDQTTEEWTLSSYRINPSVRADTFIKK
jgi:hypothetical protein